MPGSVAADQLAGLFKSETAQAKGTRRFNGKEIIHPDVTRGEIRPMLQPPAVFKNLCVFFQEQPDFDAVRAIAFPVVAREETGGPAGGK